MSNHERKIYRDPALPLNAQELHTKRMNMWFKAGMGRMDYCADGMCSGKGTVKRLGEEWLCKEHFYSRINS